MPSITYWSRLEPRPRAPSIADTLAARVRDPLWLLARQWQFGEFQGEDAGSPAYTELAAGLGALREWSTRDGDVRPLSPNAPLEPLTLAEDADPSDLSLAVELGQLFERTLAELGRPPALIDAFRAAYPPGSAVVDTRDGDALRFFDLIAGRVTDGARLFLAADAALPGLPAEPSLAPGDVDDVRTALDRLRAWVRDTVGPIGRSDADSWVPERLEYDLAVTGREPANDLVRLSAHPDRDGCCEWHAFDARAGDDVVPGDADAIQRVRRSVIPAGASFRGMPSARWWAFESGSTNLAALRPEKRELAKLVVLDFMLVHGNDWYVLPFPQPLGTLCRVESLVVHDVFGGLTLVERADRAPAAPPASGHRWTMFSTSVAGTSDVAGFFFLSPTACAAAQAGAPIEEVRLLRDEMANQAWGIERLVQGGAGEPWSGNERVSDEAPAAPPAPAAPDAVLRYRIQTATPDHWTPFLPVVIDASRRDVTLERGVLLRSAGETPAEPLGRILRPSRLAGAPYRLDEAELPRVGLRVVRGAYRSRWTDGGTFVWMARRVEPGIGEERSGLQFDVALPVE